MKINSEENRTKLIGSFPKLAGDVAFNIITNADASYNCIAWAACIMDCWWESIPEDKRPIYLNNIKIDWPFNAPNNMFKDTIVFIFSKMNYELCDNEVIENGYRKICFYSIDGKTILHASRQLIGGKNNGLWTSKLGQSYRINISDPTNLENKIYGRVLFFMKCKFP